MDFLDGGIDASRNQGKVTHLIPTSLFLFTDLYHLLLQGRREILFSGLAIECVIGAVHMIKFADDAIVFCQDGQ